ncbi:MAG: helix-turn-helix domain-containing protein [Streptosporangiaceae bacterium]
MAVAGNAEWRRRAELTGLLQTGRSRMARPVPEGNGAGLRQEDAADLAGLSVRRYAAFERGEIASPLPEMVESVASALRMTMAERSALHILATGHDPPLPPVPPGDGARPEVSPVFLELLARQDPNPAIITDETWTIVARNEAVSAWAGGWLDQLPHGQQNLVLYLFSDACEALLPDVHAARRAAIAGLRYQYARNVTSDRFAALIARLHATGRGWQPDGLGAVVAPVLTPLATALLSAPRAQAESQRGRLADEAIRIWKLRQAAHYRELTADLPHALTWARSNERDPEAGQQLTGLAALTHLYNAASSLAKSLGSFELAGIAADRAVQTAGRTGDRLLAGAAA